MTYLLEGKNIVVLDLETERSAEDCLHCDENEASHAELVHPFEPIGWHRKRHLGLSIGCYWSYTDMAYHWFDVHTLIATVEELVETTPMVVGFNSLEFDAPLMRALVRQWASEMIPTDPDDAARLMGLCDRFKTLVQTRGYDILQAIWRAEPREQRVKGLYKLDSLCRANGFPVKEMDGAEAPRRWAAGHYAAVITYNVGDVNRTRRLFEQICGINATPGRILRGDGQLMLLQPPDLESVV